MRSEVMLFPPLNVADVCEQADALARDIRLIDVRTQQTNWEVDLLD